MHHRAHRRLRCPGRLLHQVADVVVVDAGVQADGAGRVGGRAVDADGIRRRLVVGGADEDLGDVWPVLALQILIDLLANAGDVLDTQSL